MHTYSPPSVSVQARHPHCMIPSCKGLAPPDIIHCYTAERTQITTKNSHAVTARASFSVRTPRPVLLPSPPSAALRLMTYGSMKDPVDPVFLTRAFKRRFFLCSTWSSFGFHRMSALGKPMSSEPSQAAGPPPAYRPPPPPPLPPSFRPSFSAFFFFFSAAFFSSALFFSSAALFSPDALFSTVSLAFCGSGASYHFVRLSSLSRSFCCCFASSFSSSPSARSWRTGARSGCPCNFCSRRIMTASCSFSAPII
mmetsp:Transcript_101171/g.301773  ORF Transcript_101171/g.301773 Transcript_101171/m.301773 type:complete len:253 (+) Transcript_101171:148-906(+)